MDTQITPLEQRLLAAEARFLAAEQRHRQAARRCQILSGFALFAFIAAILFAAYPPALAQDDVPDQINSLWNETQSLWNETGSLWNETDDLQDQTNTLQWQTQYLSTGTDAEGYPATYVAGCNLWILNGEEATNARPNGTGNLIIG